MRAKQVGKYDIQEEIGRGGFGTVYRARDTTLDRVVALKVLHPQLLVDPTFLTRFQQEARTAARLKHPNIVTIHELGETEGVWYIAMELLEGRPLDGIISEEGHLDPERILAIARDIGAALDYAHDQGLVHRDVKPSNIIVGEDGHATLTDFGLVRAALQSTLSTTMGLIGTPAYMSPEQCEGEELDGRSDLYALGVVLYEMLTGQVPFQADTPLAVMRGHADKAPPLPRELNPDLPVEVEAVVLTALAKDRAERYASGADLAEMLEAVIRAKKLGKTIVLPPLEASLPREDQGFVAEASQRRPLPRWAWALVSAAGLVVTLLVCGLIAVRILPPAPSTPTSTASPTASVVPSRTPWLTHTTTSAATITPTSIATSTVTTTPYPLPEIAFFRASPDAIAAGDCTTLEWGSLTHASEVRIDHGIGRVSAQENQTVCPTETITYLMTATGPGGTVTALVTVTVQAGQPDLMIESVEFAPMPPVQNQDNEVRITVRNIGNAPAGAFDWDWQPGSATPFEGSLPDLDAGQSQVVTVTWHPSTWYANLPTKARVDTGNVVEESDETSNELQANVQVVPPGADVTVALTSQAALDGFRANNGGGNNTVDIQAGNGVMSGSPPQEVVIRGFMSFDLSGIPATAQVQSIQLRFYQVSVTGTPYAKLGNLQLQHVDYGSMLNDAAFDTPVLHSAILSPHTGAGEWYNITSGTLGDWIESDLAAGRTRFQLRLQFSTETDGDGLQDAASFESGENYLGTGNLPQLTITYSP